MDLWIRSQDKMMLVKVNEVAMCKLCDSYDIMVTTDVHHQFICGTYSTKEKALKVLDEIQCLLVDRYTMDPTYSFGGKALPRTCAIYQMPQDNNEQL